MSEDKLRNELLVEIANILCRGCKEGKPFTSLSKTVHWAMDKYRMEENEMRAVIPCFAQPETMDAIMKLIAANPPAQPALASGSGILVTERITCPRCHEQTTFEISVKDEPGLWVTCGVCKWIINSAITVKQVPVPAQAADTPSRRQIVFNWVMGGDLTRKDGYWGGRDEVDRADELLAALDSAAQPQSPSVDALTAEQIARNIVEEYFEGPLENEPRWGHALFVKIKTALERERVAAKWEEHQKYCLYCNQGTAGCDRGRELTAN